MLYFPDIITVLLRVTSVLLCVTQWLIDFYKNYPVSAI